MPSKTPKGSHAEVPEDSNDLTVDAAPTSIDPYAVLDLHPTATQDEVKSAYRKLALRHHPDKVPEWEKESAHTAFQNLAFAYAVLSDPRRRRRYDATGRTEESILLDDDDDFNWADFYRAQYAGAVTGERIARFAEEYKGSAEEREHVLAAYEKVEGHMGRVYQQVMLSDMLDDEERFRKIIDKAIKDGEVEAHGKYTDETEKSKAVRMKEARKRREREAPEAKEMVEKESKKGKKKGGEGAGMGDLAALIQQRQKGRAENFFDSLEAKYAPKGNKRTKMPDDEPSEEAFANNRAHGKGGEDKGGRKTKKAKR